MAETVQMNVNVLSETKEKIAEIARLTHRKPGQTIDWLVAEAWERMEEVRRPVTSLAEALEAEKVPAVEGGN